MKRILAAVAVVAAALPVPAVSAHVPRDVRAARAAWLANYRAVGHHLADNPVAEAVGKAEKAEDVSTYAYLAKAGDLDGDGHGDVADLRIKEAFDDTTGSFSVTLRLEAHAGRDGRLLWSKPIDGDLPFVIFGKVGAQGRPGVIVATYTYAGQDAFVAGAEAYTTTLTAYDGGGKSVWTSTSQGAGAGSLSGGAGTGFEIEDVGDLMPGGATDLLYVTWQYASAYDPLVGVVDNGALRLQLGVVNGATGATSTLGSPFVTTSDASYPTVVGDVTGDKRDDVEFVVGDPSGRTMQMHVVSSSDGSEPYGALNLAPDYYSGRRLTDVTGDGRADFALSDESGNLLLVDGAKGRLVWTKQGYSFSVIGDADRKRGDEILLLTTTYKSDTVGFTATVVNGAGKTVWSKARTISTGGADDSQVSVSVGDIGDVQTDGIHDVGYSIVVQPFGRATRREDATLDGRTGRLFRDAVIDMRAAGTAFDGRGVDAYTRTVAHGLLSVGGWRGDKPGKLWAVSVAVSGATRVSGSIGTDLDRDRCGDLVLSLEGTSPIAVALSGATGKPLWVLTRNGDAPGVVTHPSPRSYRRYAKTC